MLEPLTFPVTAWAPSKRPRTASSAECVHRIFTVKWIRCRCLDPDDQDRARTARLRNGAALDPERLPSYRKPTKFPSQVGFPCSVIHARLGNPRTRSLVRSIPRHPVKNASDPRELDPPFTRAFRQRATHEPEMRPADVCNLRFSKMSTRMFHVASDFVSRSSISPEDGASRGDRPLPPLLHRPSASISPARACRETATSGASVTDRATRDLSPMRPVRPRPLRPPPALMTMSYDGPKHLPSIAEPSSGPSPQSQQRSLVSLDHGSQYMFAKGGFRPPGARSC